MCVCVLGLHVRVESRFLLQHRMFLNHSWPHRIYQSFAYTCRSTLTCLTLTCHTHTHTRHPVSLSDSLVLGVSLYSFVNMLSHTPTYISLCPLRHKLSFLLLLGYVFNPVCLAAWLLSYHGIISLKVWQEVLMSQSMFMGWIWWGETRNDQKESHIREDQCHFL